MIHALIDPDHDPLTASRALEALRRRLEGATL